MNPHMCQCSGNFAQASLELAPLAKNNIKRIGKSVHVRVRMLKYICTNKELHVAVLPMRGGHQ